MSARRTGFERGFTLIELLLALTLFSIMSLLAWRGLDTVLRSRAAVESPGRAALQLSAAWRQLEADLAAARGVPQAVASAGGTVVVSQTPYIVASTQTVALLRAPAQCAGCRQGVVYDIAAAGDGTSLLRRRVTAVYTDAESARAALAGLVSLANLAGAANASAGGQPAGYTENILLKDANSMRVSVWRVSQGLGAWFAQGAAIDNVFPGESPQPSLNQGQVKSAVKVEWQLGAPWDGWVSKVVPLENRW